MRTISLALAFVLGSAPAFADKIPLGAISDYFNGFRTAEARFTQFNEDGTGVVFLGEPEPLSGDEIDRLTGLEVELWQQDQQCQGDANITGIQRELEQGIVDQLTSQFPDLGK